MVVTYDPILLPSVLRVHPLPDGLKCMTPSALDACVQIERLIILGHEACAVGSNG